MDIPRSLAELHRIRRAAMGRPIVANFYCCQGGSAKGYADAGMFPFGVDIAPQPRYPFPFIQADALEFLSLFAWWLQDYAALIDTSPPCQHYSATQRIRGNTHPALIAPTRRLLERIGRPYVLENVEEARPELQNPVMLCGAMFPNRIHTYRHRLIETGGWTLEQPTHPHHKHITVKMGRPLKDGDWYHAVGNFSNVPYVKADMGVPWMTRDGIRECIPPIYTEYIGRKFLARGRLGLTA